MYEPFDGNCQDTGNVLKERREEERMPHIQRETLQMSVSFLTSFKETSLKTEVDPYAALYLVLR
jgi:hypothetical protein